MVFSFFFFNDTATTEIYTLSLHDALPIFAPRSADVIAMLAPRRGVATLEAIAANLALAGALPGHLPVVVAAIRALADPRFNLNAIQTTTHRSEEHTSELQSRLHLVCRLLLEKKKT